MKTQQLTVSLLAAVALACPLSTNAATINYVGGDSDISRVNNIGDWTIDIGYKVPQLGTMTYATLFESGGDGTGIALGLDAANSKLIVYQDKGASTSPTPGSDTVFDLDISSLLPGKAATIRLDWDGNQATPSNNLQLTVLGSQGQNLFATATITGTNIAGTDRLGFGRTGVNTNATLSTIAGQGESSLMQSIRNSAAIPSAQIVGTLYTTTNTQAPAQIPLPSTWGVPEGGSTLAMLGLVAAGLTRVRRRRA